MLLDAGADPDALAVPSEKLTALGNLMFTPRFAGDVDLVRLLVAHGASVDGASVDGASADGARPLRSPLEIALDKGYDDYTAVMLEGHQVSMATLNHGVVAAIARENAALGQSMLEAGADANFKMGTVPVLCRTLESVQLHALALALLAHGADANAECGTGDCNRHQYESISHRRGDRGPA